MSFLTRKRAKGPPLERDMAFAAKPVLHRLVKIERTEDGNITLLIPRRKTATVKLISRVFKVSPYRQLALDQLGTFVIGLCDGQHTVRDIVDKFSKKFRLNSRREAEISMGTFLRTLAGRSIIALVLEESRETPQ